MIAPAQAWLEHLMLREFARPTSRTNK